MAKEAYPLLIKLGVSALVLLLVANISGLSFINWLALLALLLMIPVALFFRDPVRRPPGRTDVILAPADGKVLFVKKIFEDKYFHENVTTVAVFMSITDVHVNRVPIHGTVEEIDYYEGRNFVASADKSSDANEHSLILIKGEKFKLLVKQIAGFIARRIVMNLQVGQVVYPGQKLGMIRFGSRVDLFFPNDVKVLVQPGDKVTAGESIIGEFSA